jgi:hypothetical protein
MNVKKFIEGSNAGYSTNHMYVRVKSIIFLENKKLKDFKSIKETYTFVLKDLKII